MREIQIIYSDYIEELKCLFTELEYGSEDGKYSMEYLIRAFSVISAKYFTVNDGPLKAISRLFGRWSFTEPCSNVNGRVSFWERVGMSDWQTLPVCMSYWNPLVAYSKQMAGSLGI